MNVHVAEPGIWPARCRVCSERYPCEPALVYMQEARGGPGHRCRCRLCHRYDFPPIPARGTAYLALRHARLPEWTASYQGVDVGQYTILFNGHPLPPDWLVTEAYAGDAGWLIRSVRHERQRAWELQCICNAEQWPCQRVECGTVALVVAAPVGVGA